MKLTILGSTGSLGRECLLQCLEASHEITVLLRNAGSLPEEILSRIHVVQGDALSSIDVGKALPEGTDAVLFAIGMKKDSPPDLCTLATENVLAAMRKNNVPRLIWCGGGSNIQKDDIITAGARFVRWYSETFMSQKHTDKEHQIQLLERNRDLYWIGIRPLQMKPGPRTGTYRLGYNAFNGMSKISFADCAHAMVNMLKDDTWAGKMPVIQY
jgi:putative NADH-flavin reductase